MADANRHEFQIHTWQPLSSHPARLHMSMRHQCLKSIVYLGNGPRLLPLPFPLARPTVATLATLVEAEDGGAAAAGRFFIPALFAAAGFVAAALAFGLMAAALVFGLVTAALVLAFEVDGLAAAACDLLCVVLEADEAFSCRGLFLPLLPLRPPKTEAAPALDAATLLRGRTVLAVALRLRFGRRVCSRLEEADASS